MGTVSFRRRGHAGLLVAAAALGLAGYLLPWQGAARAPLDLTVLDGDTVRTGGATYRLVGFDTPETGGQARCDGERALGIAATQRLREIVAAGGLELSRVPCACAPGTEGTRDCNYGRLCAVLTAHGRDVGAILISEGLARRYVCGARRCPPRSNWCAA